MEGEPEDKIENLKKALYSRKGVSRDAHVLDLNKHDEGDIVDRWKDEPVSKEAIELDNYPQKKGSFLKKFLIFAIIFFLCSVGIASYTIFNGKNVVSPNKIEISVAGPVNVTAGDELSFEINIINKNNTPLELVDLSVKYPKGTRNTEDRTSELDRERITIDKVQAGESITKTLKMIPFGEEKEKLVMNLILEYHIPNSTSVFSKNLNHEFTIGTSPVTLTVDALDEVNSNQDLDITVTVVSNSKEVLKNILLTGDTPFGFEVKEVSPATISKKLVWALGDIEPQGKKIIKIKGRVVGEANQNRVFKFNVGAENSKSPGTVSSFIAVAVHDITIKKPFLAADILVNRKRADTFVAKSGAQIDLSIVYENNLSVEVRDIEIEARIKGDMIDKRNVFIEDGFYKSSDNTLKWTKFEMPNLKNIAPGKGGSLNATVALFSKENSDIPLFRNQSVIIDLTIKGKRLSEKGVPEEIISTVSKTIKIVSDVDLSGRVVRSVGPIENMGEVPPKVGKETGYTVIWSISNNFNNIENTKVGMILPSYVVWTGVVSPSNEKITFNSESREVTWDLGRVVARELPREVAFQVSLTPDLSQLGTSPILTGETVLEAYDSFAKIDLKDSIGEMTTNMSTDPQFNYGQDRVVE